MQSTAKAKIFDIHVEHDETGMYVATSPQLKGLLVAKQNMKALYEAIPVAISGMYEACGIEVVVTPAEDGSEYDHPWVAIPAEVAKRALQAL